MWPPDLLDLPNCVILQLLSFLDATSLYLLSKTCTRLDDLIKNHTSLWKSVDARRAPNDPTKLSYCLDMVNESTHRFLVRGHNQFGILVPPEFYTKINQFENLRVVAIESQTIDATQYSMMSFPERLHEFSMRRTVVLNSLEFFRNSGGHMKELRVLILDECSWVTSSAFMPISKYPSLEILSIYKCKNMENSIPYLSLSGHYGFKKLKIFDARLSPLGNTLIRSLYRSQSLLAIYLQNEDISYKLDYFKRKLQIIRGARSRDYSVEDDEFDLNDSLINEDNGVNNEDPAALDDRGLLDFLSTVSAKNSAELPRSSLYLDPYNNCNCGYEERLRKKQKSNPKKKAPSDSSSSDDSDDGDDHGGGGDPSVRQIENKIAHLAELVNRNPGNNAGSRGLSNRIYPRWSLALDIQRESNGNPSSTSHDSENNVCVMNLSDVRRRNRPSMSPDQRNRFLRNAYVYSQIRTAVLCGMNHNKREDMIMKLEEYRRNELPPSDHNDRGTASNTNNEEKIRHIIDIYMKGRKRRFRTSDEAGTKKPKTEEPEAGPSGLNNSREDNSDDSDFSELDDSHPHVERPPTPHPDPPVNHRPVNNQIPDDYRQIYLRNPPTVRIENFEDIRKENKVPLRRLSLRGYKKITNTALSYIKDLDLELLDLTYTNVSVDGINNYLVDHPFCRIVHEEFCVCPTNLHF